jgi:hypothetical protein
VVYRKGELSKAMIDGDWPHQIALPAYRCLGHNYMTIHLFCRAERLSLCRRGHFFRRDDMDINVFCFAERSHADNSRHTSAANSLTPKTGRSTQVRRAVLRLLLLDLLADLLVIGILGCARLVGSPRLVPGRPPLR